MERFFVIGSAVMGLSLVAYGVGCSFRSWLLDRREKNLCNRAIRLQDHHYTFPLSEEQHEELEDFGLMVELSGDPEWIEDGIEMLFIHAHELQKPDDEIGAAA